MLSDHTCSTAFRRACHGADSGNAGQGLGLRGQEEKHSWAGEGWVASGQEGSKPGPEDKQRPEDSEDVSALGSDAVSWLAVEKWSPQSDHALGSLTYLNLTRRLSLSPHHWVVTEADLPGKEGV